MLVVLGSDVGLITLLERTFLKRLLPLPHPFARLRRLRGVGEGGQTNCLQQPALPLAAARITFALAGRGQPSFCCLAAASCSDSFLRMRLLLPAV
jgi:hypothetical protein